MSKPAICLACRHCVDGTATPKSRAPGTRGGDIAVSTWICARTIVRRGPRDLVIGSGGLPVGTPCREVNTDGKCPDYQSPGPTAHDILSVVAAIAFALAALSAILWGAP
jgi:hypothetical protein